MEIIPQNKMQWFGFFLWLTLTLGVEYWIGRTKRTRANSTIELILLLSIAAYLFMITRIKKE